MKFMDKKLYKFHRFRFTDQNHKEVLGFPCFIRGVKLEFYIGGGLESPNDVINKQPPERHPQICTFSCTLYMALWLRHDWSRCFAYRVIRRQKRIGFVWPFLYVQDIANCNMLQIIWLYNYTHRNPYPYVGFISIYLMDFILFLILLYLRDENCI